MLVAKDERSWNRWKHFDHEGYQFNVTTCIAYSETKLSSRFQLKDQTKKDHQNHVVYYAKCPEEQCTEDCNGETGRCLIERVKDHSGKDLKSHLFKHFVETHHKMVTLDDFKIIKKHYKRSKFRCKSTESLHVKENCSSLNTQEASVPLKLLN